MKKLKEFIAWVGKQKGFEGMNPDQIITALNEMSSSKEGTAEVAKLMSAFKHDKKIGSASEVLKAQNGRRFDRAKSKEIMDRRNISAGNYGDHRILAKTAKAAATQGFDESMYNWDPNQTFDRERFRDRKRAARALNPEWNWRQRRAFALMNGQTPSFNAPDIMLPKTSMAVPKLEIAERGPVWIDTKSAIMRTPIVNNEKINTNVDWNSFMDEPEISMIDPTNPVMTVEQFRNHPNFRKHYLGHKTITVNGVEYPVAVTTGMYGNNLGIENDHTYAYDPKTGKIRKVEEDAVYGHIGFYGRGFDKDSEWIDMPPAEGWKYQQTGHNMNYTMPTYRTAYGQFYK